MPGKSRQVKRKIAKGKKGKRREVIQAMTQPRAVAQDREPATPAKAVYPMGPPASEPQVIASQHPYVVSELRRIGILTGIMLAVLIILSLVLS